LSREADFWHKRYTQQVRWTLETRRYIFNYIDAHPSHRILEVGCGSGAVLASLATDGFKKAFGVDKDLQALELNNISTIADGSAFNLPFSQASFDICLSHFLLLWTTYPLAALKEMKRVTKPEGWVLALAEPDYSSRIDFPSELEALGQAQSKALQSQCADVSVGRKLRGLFNDCGLENIHSGIINAEWDQNFSQPDFDIEWAVLHKDLLWTLPPEELDRYYRIDLEASRSGRRVMFVPIFFAFGQVTK
jgi:SAM-dependent methyltransferase